MEPVLFYGIPHGCSFGSIVALEWLGQPYRLSRVDMLAKEAGYAHINPTMQTPALMLEDGSVLTESLAILHHIAARDLSRGIGFAQGTRAFDELNAMLSYLHTSVHGAFGMVWNSFKQPEGSPEAAMLRMLGRDSTAQVLANLEAHLADRAWLVGVQATIADAYFAAIVRWAEDLQLFDLPREYPAVDRLLRKLEADPAMVFAHAIEDETPAQSAGGFRGHVTLDTLLPRLAA
ncbi:glutathione S-transferase family protein [Sphingomonas cavernae]|uniref:Glutathione S-transferase family protein n=1 Tax=Sphingomonas cavernae TaxID=2320861 RepID=A0A418W6P6_9SPHN|nr:glutathione S-transferase family protein [Sphingomonas cavernae]RJF85679.1 glutathione S-transferase family protein [Sphingomonas cavernae]